MLLLSVKVRRCSGSRDFGQLVPVLVLVLFAQSLNRLGLAEVTAIC